MKAQNAVCSSKQKKALVRVSGQLSPTRIRVRVRIGEQVSSGAIILEPLIRNDSYLPKILQLKFS